MKASLPVALKPLLSPAHSTCFASPTAAHAWHPTHSGMQHTERKPARLSQACLLTRFVSVALLCVLKSYVGTSTGRPAFSPLTHSSSAGVSKAEGWSKLKFLTSASSSWEQHTAAHLDITRWNQHTTAHFHTQALFANKHLPPRVLCAHNMGSRHTHNTCLRPRSSCSVPALSLSASA